MLSKPASRSCVTLLAQRAVTSVELVDAYLARIDAYDTQGPRLNAVVVRNPTARDEARAADQRRADGTTRGHQYATHSQWWKAAWRLRPGRKLL